MGGTWVPIPAAPPVLPEPEVRLASAERFVESDIAPRTR
jgi:hypothetical protein